MLHGGVNGVKLAELGETLPGRSLQVACVYGDFTPRLAGLIDELTVMTFPLLLGAGKRLFGDGTPAGALRTTEHEVTPGGTVIASYAPAGPVETGSFVSLEPGPAELERRRKIADGTW